MTQKQMCNTGNENLGFVLFDMFCKEKLAIILIVGSVIRQNSPISWHMIKNFQFSKGRVYVSKQEKALICMNV
jgi:hypothetical protein